MSKNTKIKVYCNINECKQFPNRQSMRLDNFRSVHLKLHNINPKDCNPTM